MTDILTFIPGVLEFVPHVVILHRKVPISCRGVSFFMTPVALLYALNYEFVT